MIAIKIQCPCGQRYAFDVEPVGGRMPASVACPVCNADGTATANDVIARQMASAVTPVPAIAPVATAAPRLAVAAPPQPPSPPEERFAVPAAANVQANAEVEGADTWKWWYYVLAGVCFAGYDIWRAWDRASVRPLGGLFLAAALIAVGIWDFQRKRKRRAG